MSAEYSIIGRFWVIQELGRSHLLVMTDHPDAKLLVLAYQEGATSLTEQGSLSLADHAARPAEFVTDVQVDPTGKVAVVSCYTGKFKVVALKDGNFGTSFDVMCVQHVPQVRISL